MQDGFVTNVFEVDGLEHREAVRSEHAIKIIDSLMQELMQMSLCNKAASHFLAAMEPVSGRDHHHHPVSPTTTDRLPQPRVDAALAARDALEAPSMSADDTAGVDVPARTGEPQPPWLSEDAGLLDKVIDELLRRLESGDSQDARDYARRSLQLLRKEDFGPH